MKLYHYTFSKEILTEGILTYHKHPDTRIIAKLIEEVTGEPFELEECVFFNTDKRDIGSITVSVDISELNQEFLYVADQDLANSIYREWYKGNNCDDLVKKYVSSVMKLKNYKNEYSNSEILYIDDVPAEILSVEYMEED